MKSVPVHKGESLPRVVLVGNPNTGKSLLFNCLSGACVESSNLPGVTAEAAQRTVQEQGFRYQLIDLPGVYGLEALSPDQALTWEELRREAPDLVVAVLDATHLPRNLSLLLALMALDLPLLVAGTFGDVALEEGEPVNWEKLARILEVPIVPVVPPKGWGVPELRREILRLLRNPLPRRYPLPYPRPMRRLVAQLERIAEEAGLLPRRSAALFLMGTPPRNEKVPDLGSFDRAEGAMATFRRESRIADLPLALLTFWHSLARVIAQAAQKPHRHLPRKLEGILTAPLSGTICALALLLLIFTALYLVGGWLSGGLTLLWQSGVSPLLQGAVHGLLGQTAWARVVLWGIDDGILAALTVGVPYILVFCLILGFLEDSGYLAVLSFLGERLTRLFGLPGRALISLVASAGCNVPAITGTRTLPTQRERTIACLLVLLVPCSARTGVILGAAAPYLGWAAGLSLYGILLLLILGFGLLMNRLFPGRPSAMIVEIPPLRWPQARLVWRKTWFRFADFLTIATPILILGSFLLGTLYETGAIWAVTAPLRPLVEGWMGLPAVAGLALLFSLLRKEMALQLLVVLAIAQYGTGASNLLLFMSPAQLYVFVYFLLVSFPCLSAFTVLIRELGWKRGLALFAVLLGFAIISSGLLYRLIA